MMRRSNGTKLETTLGELISAVSDAALEVCNDKDTAYLLASIALEDMFESDSWTVHEPPPSSPRELRRNIRCH